jgi:hypothetical protein
MLMNLVTAKLILFNPIGAIMQEIMNLPPSFCQIQESWLQKAFNENPAVAIKLNSMI